MILYLKKVGGPCSRWDTKSWANSVGAEHGYGHDSSGVEFRHEQKVFLFSKTIQTVPGTHRAYCSISTAGLVQACKAGRGVNLTIHVHLAQRVIVLPVLRKTRKRNVTITEELRRRM